MKQRSLSLLLFFSMSLTVHAAHAPQDQHKKLPLFSPIAQTIQDEEKDLATIMVPVSIGANKTNSMATLQFRTVSTMSTQDYQKCLIRTVQEYLEMLQHEGNRVPKKWDLCQIAPHLYTVRPRQSDPDPLLKTNRDLFEPIPTFVPRVLNCTNHKK